MLLHTENGFTGEGRNKGSRAFNTCMVMVVMACHVLPWRETDTNSSFAVEADLARRGAHDDRHPLSRTVREKRKKRRRETERKPVRNITLQGVIANYRILFELPCLLKLEVKEEGIKSHN